MNWRLPVFLASSELILAKATSAPSDCATLTTSFQKFSKAAFSPVFDDEYRRDADRPASGSAAALERRIEIGAETRHEEVAARTVGSEDRESVVAELEEAKLRSEAVLPARCRAGACVLSVTSVQAHRLRVRSDEGNAAARGAEKRLYRCAPVRDAPLRNEGAEISGA